MSSCFTDQPGQTQRVHRLSALAMQAVQSKIVRVSSIRGREFCKVRLCRSDHWRKDPSAEGGQHVSGWIVGLAISVLYAALLPVSLVSLQAISPANWHLYCDSRPMYMSCMS